MKLKPGMFLVLETGEYGDYTFHGPFVIIREFDQAEAVAAHRAYWKSRRHESVEPDPYGFMAWLTAEHLIEHATNVVAWPIGTYGQLEAHPQPEPSAAKAQE